MIDVLEINTVEHQPTNVGGCFSVCDYWCVLVRGDRVGAPAGVGGWCGSTRVGAAHHAYQGKPRRFTNVIQIALIHERTFEHQECVATIFFLVYGEDTHERHQLEEAITQRITENNVMIASMSNISEITFCFGDGCNRRKMEQEGSMTKN